MRRGVNDLIDEVLVLQLRGGDPTAPTALRLKGVSGNRLHVARLGERDDDVLVVNQVLHAQFTGVIHNGRAAIVGELVADRCYLFTNNAAQLGVAGQD